MPALADRDQYEAAIVAALAPIFAEQYERAVEAGAPYAVPYDQFEGDVRRVLADELFRAFSSAGVALVIGNSFTLSQALFEDTARRWSADFAGKTAAQVVNTSKRLTREAWKIGQGDRRAPHQIEADFQRAMQMIYSPARINAIAVTSVTAAVSQGEHAVVFFFPENRRRRLIAVWVTVEEAPGVPALSVCEICAPFDRHTREVWGHRFPFGSPAHVNCMCHLLWMEESEWARMAA